MIRALDSGSLDVTIVGGGQALNAYVKGVEVRIISGLVNTVPFQLWAKPELAQLKDLKGKLIANTPPGTSLNLANQILLMRVGLDPMRDVKLGVRSFGACFAVPVHRGGRCRASIAAGNCRSEKIRTTHVNGHDHCAYPLPFHLSGYLQGHVGKIPIIAGSISKRDSSRDQTCVDQSRYGKKDSKSKHATHRPGST